MEDTPNLLKFEIDNVINKKITQSGIHQSDLLCADCDNEIGRYDKYGYKVLPAETDPQKLKSLLEASEKSTKLGKST